MAYSKNKQTNKNKNKKKEKEILATTKKKQIVQ
jgi:hypothetical protein